MTKTLRIQDRKTRISIRGSYTHFLKRLDCSLVNSFVDYFRNVSFNLNPCFYYLISVSIIYFCYRVKVPCNFHEMFKKVCKHYLPGLCILRSNDASAASFPAVQHAPGRRAALPRTAATYGNDGPSEPRQSYDGAETDSSVQTTSAG